MCVCFVVLSYHLWVKGPPIAISGFLICLSKRDGLMYANSIRSNISIQRARARNESCINKQHKGFLCLDLFGLTCRFLINLIRSNQTWTSVPNIFRLAQVD